MLSLFRGQVPYSICLFLKEASLNTKVKLNMESTETMCSERVLWKESGSFLMFFFPCKLGQGEVGHSFSFKKKNTLFEHFPYRTRISTKLSLRVYCTFISVGATVLSPIHVVLAQQIIQAPISVFCYRLSQSVL